MPHRPRSLACLLSLPPSVLVVLVVFRLLSSDRVDRRPHTVSEPNSFFYSRVIFEEYEAHFADTRWGSFLSVPEVCLESGGGMVG